METGSLYTSSGYRKYLTPIERQRFMAVADTLPHMQRLLCLTLLWTGMRLSEALALRPEHVSVDEGVVVIRSLKKRGKIVHRRVPVPKTLLTDLSGLPVVGLPWRRTQAWHLIKTTMARADIIGPQACPRGLRHSFAVHAISSGVPLHLVQRWLGHARLETSAIYSNAIGNEEQVIAGRMWV